MGGHIREKNRKSWAKLGKSWIKNGKTEPHFALFLWFLNIYNIVELNIHFAFPIFFSGYSVDFFSFSGADKPGFAASLKLCRDR